MNFIKKNIHLIIFAAILVIFNCITLLYYNMSISGTNGSYIYPLDDVYIHLSIAKNFALNNTWGVSANEFCSTSSSPIYTYVLSCLIKFFGLSESYPLIFNFIFSNLLFIVIYKFFKNNVLKLLAMSTFLITPTLLHVQVLSGMEHVLQIFLVLSTFCVLYAMNNGNKTKYSNYLYYGLIALLCLTRFEGMFFLSAIIFATFINKDYKRAALTAIVGFLPVVLFGIFSISHGGYFFPNSLMIKGNIHNNDIMTALTRYARVLVKNLYPLHISIPMLIIVLIGAYQFKSAYGKISIAKLYDFLRDKQHVIILFVTLILHAVFAAMGWLYRYEAYLLAMLYLVLIIECSAFINQLNSSELSSAKNKYIYAVGTLMLIIAFAASIFRMSAAGHTIHYAGQNIYQQQIQMSRMLGKYYNDSKVIANDIGAISYFTNIKVLDLVGLGSNTILRQLKSDKQYGKNFKTFINSSPQNQYKIAIIYDSWFDSLNVNQAGWIKVGQWQIDGNVICGDDKVAFYATDSIEARKFKANLLKYTAYLPKQVKVTLLPDNE